MKAVARGRGRGVPKKPTKKAGDKPSQWQLKYGKGTSQKELEQDDKSLEEWIALVQERADATASVPEVSFEQLFMPDNASSDKDAVDVISQMNMILDGTMPISDDNDDIGEISCRHSFDLGVDRIEFDNTFSNYLQVPSIDCGPFENSVGNSEEAFGGENMAILFRRSHDEKILRKCFDCLLSHMTGNKLLRCRAFSGWKRITKEVKESQCQLIRRSRRRQKFRRIRRTLSAWLNLSHGRSILINRAIEMSDWRTKSKVLTSWCSLLRRKKSRRMEAGEKLERVKLAKLIKKADNFWQSKLKRSLVARWLAVTNKSKSNVKTARDEPKDVTTSAIIREESSDIIAQDETPSKTPKAKKATCITPDAKESAETCEFGGAEKSPLVKELASARKASGVSSAINQNREKKAHKRSNEVSKTGGEMLAAPQRIKCVEKENRQPNRIRNVLLRPLKPQRSKPQRTPSTPKMVLEMDQRKREREKRGDVLRHRYEQKAIEKRKWLEEEKLRKEKVEMKVQEEYIQCKAAELHRKKMVSARWKQACRLAALHYRMSLQKRMLLQWKKIFQITDFNERKACIAWSDATYEKCWQIWKFFKEEEQRKRRKWMLKAEKLADNFNERRLLAKSFAALEEHCQYTRSILDEAQCQVSALRRMAVFDEWHRIAIKAKKERCIKEKEAAKNGEKLILLRAMQSWHSGVNIYQEERAMDILIEAKWEQINKWLE